MSTIGLIHLVLSVTALGAGVGVLLLPKGTARHRRIGWIYTVGMVGLNVTGLSITRLFGGFGPFHVAALLSLATVIAGVVPAVRRRPRGRWIAYHAYLMSWSYVGLLAAAASEATTRLPEAPFWGMVAFSSAVVFLVGAWVVTTRVPRTLRAFRRPPG